jgi:hypothetical protein
MFRVNDTTGFQMVFANGVTASIQFSRNHYCANRYGTVTQPNECPDAEVAFFRDGEWLTNVFDPRKDDGDVRGYVDPDQLIPLLVAAQAYQQWVLVDTVFIRGQAIEIYGRSTDTEHDCYKAVFNGIDVVVSPGILSRIVIEEYFTRFFQTYRR